MLDLTVRPSRRWTDVPPRLFWWLLVLVTVPVSPSSPLFAQPIAPTTEAEIPSGLPRALSVISGSRMLEDVTRFSQPEFNGRQTGTTDDRRTALLVATLFH